MPTPNMQISVTDDEVLVTMGQATVKAPIEELAALADVLGAVRVIVQARPAAVAAKNVKQPPKKAAAPKRAARARAKAKKAPKRSSRKRVAPALQQWMTAHPGWRSEQELLDAIVEHEMSDARPFYALKIALGRGRGTLFEEGTKGNWKLVSDTAAGPSPKPRPRRKPSMPRRAKKTKKSTGRKAPAKRARAAGKGRHAWWKVDEGEVNRARKNLLGLSKI